MTGVQILDAVTLKQLKSITCSPTPQDSDIWLFRFSPKSHILTCYSRTHDSGLGTLVNWDLQTGIPVTTIPVENSSTQRPISITYSGCETMFGVLSVDYKDNNHVVTAISSYDIPSGRRVYYHPIEGSVATMIWACGVCVRFATLGAWAITIWEVGFTSKSLPAEVESLPTPDNFDPSDGYLFLPTLSRLAFNPGASLLVWDARHSKLLLDSMDMVAERMAFSPDGCFFGCITPDGEICLWKESLASYTPYQRFISRVWWPSTLHLSPNGQSIVIANTSTLQLWHTADLATFPSGVPTQPVHINKHFILEFSMDGSLAAATQLLDKTVTVLNLKSGVPQLTIDTGMCVYGLKLTGSTIFVIGNGQIITWNLPIGNHTPNSRSNIDDSIQTIFFHYSGRTSLRSASISPDFSYIAIHVNGLRLYDMSTGKLLAGVVSHIHQPWFTSDGHEVWSLSLEHGGWTIIKDRKSNTTKLKPLGQSEVPSGGPPWQSPHGYQVTDHGWIHSPSGKPLLWLPHHWRSGQEDMVWGGQFLGFLHYELPEVVILELLEE